MRNAEIVKDKALRRTGGSEMKCLLSGWMLAALRRTGGSENELPDGSATFSALRRTGGSEI